MYLRMTSSISLILDHTKLLSHVILSGNCLTEILIITGTNTLGDSILFVSLNVNADDGPGYCFCVIIKSCSGFSVLTRVCNLNRLLAYTICFSS